MFSKKSVRILGSIVFLFVLIYGSILVKPYLSCGLFSDNAQQKPCQIKGQTQHITLQDDGHRNIIFDLSGVLLKTNEMVVAKKAGLMRMAFYSIFHSQNPRQALFDMLEQVPPFTHTAVKACDELGNELPDIMCDWLKGVPSHDILERIYQSARQDSSLWKLAQAVFDPETMAKSQRLCAKAKNFVERCVQQGHHVYILSNWDGQSFEQVKQRNPEFFQLFSGIVLSGDCGLLKPDLAIYNHLLNKYQIEPKTCFFIDNQLENIKGASSAGIQAHLLKTTPKGRPDFEHLQQDLEKWLLQTNNTVKYA